MMIINTLKVHQTSMKRQISAEDKGAKVLITWFRTLFTRNRPKETPSVRTKYN